MPRRSARRTTSTEPAPQARWDDDDSASPDLVWWAQLDGRYLVEVVRAATPSSASLRIFDHARGDVLLLNATVPLADAAEFGPAIEDVVAWQQCAVTAVAAAPSAATHQERFRDEASIELEDDPEAGPAPAGT